MIFEATTDLVSALGQKVCGELDNNIVEFKFSPKWGQERI